MMKDYFEVLDIGEDTGEQAIKDAYRLMLSKYPASKYPEKNREIEEAYEMLCNPAVKSACLEFHRMERPSKEAYRLASDAITEGRFAEAAKILEKAILKEKHTIHLNYLLGIAYLSLEKPSKAAKALEPVSNIYPCDVMINTLFIKACLDSRKFRKAVMRAEECLVTNGDEFVLVHLLAEGYMQLGKYGEATELLINAYNNAVFADRLHNICTKLTYVYFLDGKINKCLEWLDKLTILPADDEEKEDSAEVVIDMLYHFIEMYMFFEAGQCADAVLKLTPGREDVAEIKRGLDDLLRIEPEIESFDDDEFIPDILKIYTANVIFSNWTQELPEEQQTAYSVLLEYQILNGYGDLLMALRYMKNKYPLLYGLKADFFDALQDTRERKKLTNRNKALFYQYQGIIAELMDELDYGYDNDDEDGEDYWDEDFDRYADYEWDEDEEDCWEEDEDDDWDAEDYWDDENYDTDTDGDDEQDEDDS